MKKYVQILIDSSNRLAKISKGSSLDTELLTKVIAGDAELTMSQLLSLSKYLKLPLSYLVEEYNSASDYRLLFRNAANSQSAQEKVDILTQFVTESVKYFPNRISDKQPQFRSEFNTNDLAIKANEYARKFRSIYLYGDYFSPLVMLPKVVEEELGVILVLKDIGADGLTAIIDNIPYIFIKPTIPSRMLFTLAHEVAHLLAHIGLNENFVKFDNTNDDSYSRKNEENFANAFASALLLPQEGFLSTIRLFRKKTNVKGHLTDIELLFVSRTYGVSFLVAAKRAEDFELLPKGGANSLYQYLKDHHRSPEIRANEVGLPPANLAEFPSYSRLLLRSVINEIVAGNLSIGKAAEALGISQSQIMDANVR